MMSKNAFLIWLSQGKLLAFFLLGKIVRFVIFIGFLIYLLKTTNGLVGYTPNQVIFFFLTFNLVDIVSQFLFRYVYSFRQLVVSGDFDLVLTKPFSPLFRSLMGGADLIDLITIPPLIGLLYYYSTLLNPSASSVLLYLFLLVCSFIISAALHIITLSLGIITLEVDHTIMIFRDFLSLGRLPVGIYKQPLQVLITYLVPIGIMITFPVRGFIGSLPVYLVLISVIFAAGLLFGSLKFWQYALKRYSSASS